MIYGIIYISINILCGIVVDLGNIIVISAPSGAGKSTLVRELCKLDNQVKLSISHTTRNKRNGEIDGVDYYFVTTNQFKIMLDNNEFIEHALVYDNYYGTNKQTINNFIQQGCDIILEIDHQGALQIKQLIPDATLVYITPPNTQELENRLRKRNTDSEEVILKRLAQANHDMSYSKYFDYVIINDNLQKALLQLHSIIINKRKVIKKPISL